MIRKNKIEILTILLVLAVFAIALTGCSTAGRFFKGKTNEIPTYEYRSGTQGLKMEFVNGMPPDQIYAGTEFAIGLKVKNEGAYSVKDQAILGVLVPDFEAFEFPKENTANIILEAKSLYMKEGQEEIFSFPVKSVCIPYGSFRKNYSANIVAAMCYYYETISQADICVDTLFYRRQPGLKPECEMKVESMSGGQGGPVGVTSVPPPQIIEKGGDKVTVQITIPIKNLGGRSVTVYNPSVDCTDPKSINEIGFEVQLAGKPMKCRPTSILKIKEASEKGVVCTVEMDPNQGAFITPLQVKTKYNVMDKALKKLVVNPPPEGAKAVDCSTMGREKDGECAKTFSDPPHTCQDVSLACPNADAECLQKLNCKAGYCPGAKTIVCCPQS